MLMFVCGMFAGAALGVVTVCLCVAAGEADRAEERRIPGGGKGHEE